MAHCIRVFAGLPSALRPFLDLTPAACLYTLTPDADIAVLPFDDDAQDALHRRFGTGDWPEGQAMGLSTTDQSFAAACSVKAPLAYLETEYFGGRGRQSAALWRGGRLAIPPATVDSADGTDQRALTLWPINVVLRALGVAAGASVDEFSAFALDGFRSNEKICATAWLRRA